MEIISASEAAARASAAGISIHEWADLASVAPSTIYRWISGETSPTIALYKRLILAIPEPANRR